MTTHQASEAQVARLATVLGEIHRLRSSYAHPSLPLFEEREIVPHRFVRFLEQLSPAVQAARRSGLGLNVWTVAGLGNDEVRTTKALAWSLDCNASHGLGAAVLRALISRLLMHPRNQKLQAIEIGDRYTTHAEHSAFSDATNRIDIAVTLANAVIMIEAKIDAPEGVGQLARYQAVAEAKRQALGKENAFVFYLTRSLRSRDNEIVTLTWRDVAQAIDDAVVSESADRTIPGQFLMQLAQHCRTLR